MNKHPDDAELLTLARSVIKIEADALHQLGGQIGPQMAQAARMIFAAKGHCIVSGIGKSGHIGRKIAATLSSTGTPAFFIHPTEASHGDLGMIASDACVLAISNSGETREMRDLIVHCKNEAIPLLAFCGKPDSFLSKNADITVPVIKAPEACPNGLAPTTSTTLTLAMGDALSICVMHLRDFTREDFGRRHPGGTLGLQLQKVGTYLLENPQNMPSVSASASGRDVISAITEGRQGCVAVIDKQGNFAGMITDGDLRRAMQGEFFDKTAAQMMTVNPVTASPSQRMSELIEQMISKRISNLFVVENKKPIGLIHIKDLMQQGYF